MDVKHKTSVANNICPVPLTQPDHIVIGHGSGGLMTHDLITKIFYPRLQSDPLKAGNDAAAVYLPDLASLNGQIVASTDSHIVSPLFFPGGDIGRLAVCGTINDISMLGAQPLYLTAGFILEEGFPIHTLEKVLDSMQAAAVESRVQFIAGDTKVVEKGKADGIFINTTGIGWLPPSIRISGDRARPEDVIILSGTIGEHGIAVLAARGELGFETSVCSDVAPLNHLVQEVIKAAPETHVLRDPTRGGLATTLNEIAIQSNVGIHLDQSAIPILPPVRAVSEMLGLDPLYIANEGKFIAILPPHQADAALEVLQSNPLGRMATRIGTVTSDHPKRVLLYTQIGGIRLLDLLAGEMLPRIC